MEYARKEPVIAVVLSLIIWGLGQIYVGRTKDKKIVGVLMMAFDFLIIWYIIANLTRWVGVNSGDIAFRFSVMFIISLIMTPLSIYDAYLDAIKFNKEIEGKIKLQNPVFPDINRPNISNNTAEQKLQIEGNKKKKKPKFCSECGNKIEGNPKFCPECGNKLER